MFGLLAHVSILKGSGALLTTAVILLLLLVMVNMDISNPRDARQWRCLLALSLLWIHSFDSAVPCLTHVLFSYLTCDLETTCHTLGLLPGGEFSFLSEKRWDCSSVSLGDAQGICLWVRGTSSFQLIPSDLKGFGWDVWRSLFFQRTVVLVLTKQMRQERNHNSQNSIALFIPLKIGHFG